MRSSRGTATCSVTSTSEIVRNGQAAALSAVQVGDAVFLHVYPDTSGQTVVERLYAGTSASNGGFAQPSDGSDDGPTTQPRARDFDATLPAWVGG